MERTNIHLTKEQLREFDELAKGAGLKRAELIRRVFREGGKEMTYRYAEEANYWTTTVAPTKSKAEIEQLLDDFGATQQMTAKGQVNGRVAWLIRFAWNGQSYRFTFTPLECKHSDKVASFGGKRRSHLDQAEYQMGRIAVHFVKAILTAAEAHPHALFGFMEIPGTASGGAMPKTAGELDVSGVMSALPAPEEFLLTG